MSKIIKGDRVVIHWNLEGGEEILVGIVLSTPDGVGGMWYIKDEHGFVSAINPYNHSLARIVRVKREVEVDDRT